MNEEVGTEQRMSSYKQARSIGSVASKSKHLQLFALDFKDEPTALHAHFVLQQAVFVNEAIKAVHALYEAKNGECQICEAQCK